MSIPGRTDGKIRPLPLHCQTYTKFDYSEKFLGDEYKARPASVKADAQV